jgi:hypothetical protein
MPSLIGQTSGGVSIAANYLRVLPSPGAALTGVANGAPLLTFSTPNLQLFRVSITSEDLTATPEAADSSWSKVIRAIQVTSEVFAVFAPDYDSSVEGGSTFCYLAPDFNTNPGATTGDAVTGATTYSIVEAAIVAAVGGTAEVTKVALTGITVA